MTVRVTGVPGLRARLEGIKPSAALMRNLALRAVAEQKILVPRKTGNLGRSIGIGSVTATSAETIAAAGYAAHVELGTGLYGPKRKEYYIVPKARKALRFAVGGNARLSGSPRKGAPVIFAKRVKHPGTRAKPYMLPGAQRAVAAIRDIIVSLWNGAA